MKQLKMWIGRYFDNDPNYSSSHTKECAIIAYTKKQAMELSGLSNRELSVYFHHDTLGKFGSPEIKENCTSVGFWIIDDPYSTLHNIPRRIK